MSARIPRRMFLRGAAGFTLAIPFLPSLLDRREAKAGPLGTSKRFVALATDHGGIWQGSMYPLDTALTKTASYAGHQIRQGALTLDVADGIARLSPVLSASSDAFTTTLAQKMNVLRGLDVTFYLGHHRGGHLGNFAENDGNGTDSEMLKLAPRATIDQVMAWSPTFYADLATIKERSLVIGGQGMSAAWSSPTSKTGEIQNISPENDSLALFNKIFVPPSDATQTRPQIVDMVLEDYKRLRNANVRLSQADRQRLDDHLERLDELQRKLGVKVSCGDVQPPTKSSIDELGSSYGIDPEANKRFWQLHNDVVAAAFACDTCRVVTMRVADNFSTFAGDWHQDVAHQAAIPDGIKQDIIATAHQRFFEDVYLDLVAKLDGIADFEGTVLDNALVQWTQEAGCLTHDPIELPVVTAGGAGGSLATGKYADYRNLQAAAHQSGPDNAVSSHVGLAYNQWLGTALQSMGVPKSEYEDGDHGGYGLVHLSTETWYAGYQKYPPSVIAAMGDVLPFLAS